MRKKLLFWRKSKKSVIDSHMDVSGMAEDEGISTAGKVAIGAGLAIGLGFLLKKLLEPSGKKCWYCKKTIHNDSQICPHCLRQQ